ncbi:hypothetical protein [Nocardioides ferulae]|uniref:hypothetical protein n=1 Tax=Nocardioides ferulae TaxID=2340821 RepID=UPI000EB572B1|nr:hypothetical protein [Nocardioides ferulae]
MAWEEELFAALDDLEQQAEALYDAEREIDLADRARAEYQQVSLAARLMASLERDLVIDVDAVGRVAGRLHRVADGWCLLRGPGQDWVLSLAAVRAVEGASPRAVPEVAWPVVAKLGLGSALRRLADERVRCVLHLRDGTRHDGVLTRVGRDFVELATGADRTVLVAWEGLCAVQNRG